MKNNNLEYFFAQLDKLEEKSEYSRPEFKATTVFNYETYTDKRNNQRQKMTCIKEVTVDGHTYYVRGSTVCSLTEEFNANAGRNIAEERARKVLYTFYGNPNLKQVVIRTEALKSHMRLFSSIKEPELPECMIGSIDSDSILSDLEKKLLAVKKERKNINSIEPDLKYFFGQVDQIN